MSAGMDAKKVRYSKCAMCSERTDMRLLYVVLDKKMCFECGKNEIKQWNAWVKDSESP